MLYNQFTNITDIVLPEPEKFNKAISIFFNKNLPYVLYNEDIDFIYGYFYEDDFKLPFVYNKKNVNCILKIAIYFQIRVDQNEDKSYKNINLIDICGFRVILEDHQNYINKLKSLLNEKAIISFDFFLKYLYFYDNYEKIKNGKHGYIEFLLNENFYIFNQESIHYTARIIGERSIIRMSLNNQCIQINGIYSNFKFDYINSIEELKDYLINLFKENYNIKKEILVDFINPDSSVDDIVSQLRELSKVSKILNY